MTKLVKRKKQEKIALVKRDKRANPLGYKEWRNLIVSGLKDKTICLYPPDILFDYRTLERKKVPTDLMELFEKKGIIVRELEHKQVYFRLGPNFR